MDLDNSPFEVTLSFPFLPRWSVLQLTEPVIIDDLRDGLEQGLV
jgi:hypothetical protein